MALSLSFATHCRREVGVAASVKGDAQVDEAAELWGVTDKELKEIRRSLEELG